MEGRGEGKHAFTRSCPRKKNKFGKLSTMEAVHDQTSQKNTTPEQPLASLLRNHLKKGLQNDDDDSSNSYYP